MSLYPENNERSTDVAEVVIVILKSNESSLATKLVRQQIAPLFYY